MRKKKNAVLIILIALTVGFIWVNSMMPAQVSSAESGMVLRCVKPFLEIFLGEGGATELVVRKLAHFAEFSVLGCMLAGYAVCCAKTWRVRISVSLGGGLLAAVLDETIQLFAEGRSSGWRDVLLDFSGAAAGSAAVFLIVWIVGRVRRR